MSSNLKVAIFDIETNGFYEEVTDLWCMWVIDVETGEECGFRPGEFEQALVKLDEFDVIAGHNIIDYDLPVLKKFYKDWVSPPSFDTLVLSRMLEPDRFSHALKSYGKQLDNAKGDYGEQEEAWDAFTEDMYDYCLQDVRLNLDVYNKLCKDAGFDTLNPPAYSKGMY